MHIKSAKVISESRLTNTYVFHENSHYNLNQLSECNNNLVKEILKRERSVTASLTAIENDNGKPNCCMYEILFNDSRNLFKIYITNCEITLKYSIFCKEKEKYICNIKQECDMYKHFKFDYFHSNNKLKLINIFKFIENKSMRRTIDFINEELKFTAYHKRDDNIYHLIQDMIDLIHNELLEHKNQNKYKKKSTIYMYFYLQTELIDKINEKFNADLYFY